MPHPITPLVAVDLIIELSDRPGGAVATRTDRVQADALRAGGVIVISNSTVRPEPFDSACPESFDKLRTGTVEGRSVIVRWEHA